MVEPGVVLCGKYRIERLLGKGGMGLVACARHLDLDQSVALKLLLPEVLRNRDVVKRFRREAQAMVQLKGEHVCRVFDVGALDDGTPFMVMEYLEGQDLGLLLREQGRLTPGFAVDLVLQVCEALAEAHALGIVHRDIKPANCFLTHGPDGEPLLKVLDFGISKALGVADGGITTSQTLIGSPSYMSPEQMHSSKNVDARTDIWALGTVLYELVSGRRPFVGDSFAALCLAVTTKPMLALDDVVLPDGLVEVIARCLEKQPEGRFGSMAELSAAIAPYAGTREQGERSSARSARMLGRASSPLLIAPGSPAGIAPVVLAGSPVGQETIAGTGAARKRGRQVVSTLSTATASPSAEPAHRESQTSEAAPEHTPRPLQVVSRARTRWWWLLATAGLALFAAILVLGVVHGASEWPQPTVEPRAGQVEQSDDGVQPAPAASVSQPPANAASSGTQGASELDAINSDKAAESSDGAAPHRADQGGDEGRRARGRSTTRRHRPASAPARNDREAPPHPAPAATVQTLIDDAAFGSRE